MAQLTSIKKNTTQESVLRVSDGIRNFKMVPEARIELARKYKFRGILNPLCLPISPLGHWHIWWRRVPESDWTRRICNPLHNRFANAPNLERETRLELATSTLARLHSTNWVIPAYPTETVLISGRHVHYSLYLWFVKIIFEIIVKKTFFGCFVGRHLKKQSVPMNY